MTIGRTLRQILYTLILLGFLKGCTPLLTEASAEEAWLTVDVYPKVSMTPINGTAAIRLLVTIPKSDLNRILCFGYDGAQFRSSCEGHVGQGARYRLEWTFQGLPPGEYVAFAELVRDEGEKRRQSQVVTAKFVICGDGGCGGAE